MCRCVPSQRLPGLVNVSARTPHVINTLQMKIIHKLPTLYQERQWGGEGRGGGALDFTFPRVREGGRDRGRGREGKGVLLALILECLSMSMHNSHTCS